MSDVLTVPFALTAGLSGVLNTTHHCRIRFTGECGGLDFYGSGGIFGRRVGSRTLSPYIIFSNAKTGFNISCLVTIMALILFGYFKSKATGQPTLKGMIKVALTGITAAGAAYLLTKAVN